MPTSRSSRRCAGLALAGFLVVLPPSVRAEDATDLQGWVEYQYRHQINDRIRSSWGLGYRELLSTEDRLSDWARLHLRGFLTYHHSARVNFEAGLGSYYNLLEPQKDTFELRLWQGVLLQWPGVNLPRRQFGFQHRMRFEQRWFRESGSGETEFASRLRYRLSTGIPLNNPTIEAGTYYLPLGAEWFYDIGDDTAQLFAARARLTTGLGYVFSDNWALEFRYTAQRSRGTVLEQFTTTDHIIDLRIRTSLRLRDLSTPW